MTKILKILFSIYFSFILLDANSQVVAPVVQSEKCGSAQLHNQQLQSNPNYALKMQQFETLVEQINNGSVPKAGTIYKIPVVVHVMSDGTSLTNVTDEQIRISIRTLNELYRKVAGTKGDGSGVDVELEFALAVRDPQGNCTSGINRINMTGNSTYMASGVFSSSAGISDASLKAIYNWDQTQYYNIWLVSEIDNNNGGAGIQGYAYFASSHGTSIDGAVILANNFKDVNSTTAAHEIGHALNLFHTFEGDGTGGTCPLNANCATDGDLVCDTPPHMRSVSNCNTGGTNSCDGNSSNLLFVRNYMDYSSDACQNMFTDGQRTRARAALTSQRASFLAENGNMSLVPPSAPTIDFSGSKTILCGTGQTVTFYDNSSCIPNTFLPTTNWAGITFLWTISNGVNTYTSTNQNPVITFANTGTFDVTLQITNGFGTFSYTKQGMVVVSVAPTSACTPTSSNTGNFGQTITSVKFNTINNATSTAANIAYTNNACTINTIVAPGSTYPLIVGINAGGSAAEVFEAYIDYNNDGDFADAGESLGGGTTPTNSNNTVTLNVTIPAGAVQNTLLRMRIIGEAGSISANKRNCLTSYFIGDVEDYGVFISNKVASVTIAAAPGTTISYGTNVTFTATPVNGGASPTYTWYKNNVLQSGFTTNTYSNNTLVQGDQIYCKMFSNLLNVVSSPATSNTLTMTVTGPPLTAFVGVDTLVCAGSTVQYTDLSQLAPTSWNWTFTGGTPASSTSQNPLITYNTPGTYSVTLTTSNGLGTGTTVTKTGYITVFTTPGAQCSAFTRTNTPIGNIGLTKVKLNTIDHTTAFNDAVYQSFTCTKKTQLNVSTSYTLNLSVSEGNAQWIRVYIDYNNNNSFLDAGELIYTTNSALGLVSATFTTPAAPTLNTLLRMRVITDFNGSATAGSCKTPLSYGQVEDYGIIMRNNCTLPATPGAITGVTTTCANTTGLTYSVGLVAGATTYNWSLPAGATITAGTGTNSITVSMGSSSGTISVTAQNACGTSAASSQSVTVNPLNTVAAGINRTTCINTAITAISLATTGATGATVTGLPAGVTGTWSANTVTISGTPTASGTFNYTVTTTGGCPPATTTGTITVTPLNTVAAGINRTTCVNTAITTISLATTGATGATVTGLPAGVTGTWSANTVTISGTPTASGTFNYTVTTTGGCPPATTTGTITVTPLNTVAAGINRTTCVNTAITTISLATTGATGATVTGLPSGVTGTWSANTVTISGTPTASGTFNYTVTTTGGCTPATTTGVITVNPANTAVLSSAVGTNNQSVCLNTPITTITYTTTGATGATFSGLPTGVSGVWSANVVTISGTPSVAGTFNYTVTLTGGCGTVTATGSIGVVVSNTNNLTSSVGTNAQTVCSGTAITNITYATTGATGATVTGLPAGVTGVWSANVVTISGTPTASGTFNYTVTLTGGCGAASSTGSITVNPLNTVAAGVNRTTCINSAITTISLATTGATGATVTGLPAGVTGTWSANTVTISGTPTASGTFNYTVTTTGGCPPATTTGSITVTPLNTVAAGINRTICVNTAITTISLATTGATGATVTGLPAGVTGTWSANTVTISGTPTASGTFNYTVTTTGGCTPATTTGVITVNPVPATPTISAGGATTFCAGGSVVLTSSNATGNMWSTGETTQSITVSTSGTYTVTVSNGSCSAASTGTTITVNPVPSTPTISAGGATTFCNGGSVVLTSSNATGNTWSTGETTQSITVSASGTYTVTVSNGSCSAASSGTTITVNPVPATPTISAGGATTFCDGGSVVLTSSSATGNMWSTGETTQSITVSTSGTYTVTVSNGSCSAASAGTTITVNPVPATPTILASGATTFCDGGSVVLTSSSATGNTWSTGETSQSITVSTAGTYTVTVGASGCSATSTGTLVAVNANPTVGFGAIPDVCVYSAPVTLNTGTPAGGSYSGTGVTSGMFDPNVAGTGTTTLTYSFTDGNGCSGNANTSVTVDACASLEESVVNAWSMYPNPTTSSIIVNWTGKAKTLKVYDNLGKLIIDLQPSLGVTTMVVDLSTVANGVYTVQFELDATTTQQQLIVNR